MANAAFYYLEGENQIARLNEILRECWPWLAGATAPSTPLHALLESPEAVDLRWVTQSENLADWPLGRVFGPQGELTWRREDNLTHLVLVTERIGLPTAFTGALPLTQLTVDPNHDQVLLWGERQADGAWRETRLPDPLHYPVADARPGQRVMLQVRRYRAAPDQEANPTDGTENAPEDASVDFVRYLTVSLVT